MYWMHCVCHDSYHGHLLGQNEFAHCWHVLPRCDACLPCRARADEPPRIVKWNSLADGFLQLVVQKDGKVFTGALMYQ